MLDHVEGWCASRGGLVLTARVMRRKCLGKRIVSFSRAERGMLIVEVWKTVSGVV